MLWARELVGLGIDPVTSTRRASVASSRRRGKDLAQLEIESPDTQSSQQPATNFHRSDSLVGSEGGSPIEEHEPVIGTAQVARLSRASMSPPSSPKGHKRGASSISQMIELTKSPTTTPSAPPVPPKSAKRDQPMQLEPSRTSSEASTGKARQHHSWTSFFKRNSKEKRTSIPSSFSNTSRESSLAATPMPYVYTAKRASASSSVPKRTMSRFREDLPENRLPLSPPDSRVQSPDADAVPPMLNTSGKKDGGRGSNDTPSPFGEQTRRHDTPTSGYHTLEAARGKTITPIPINRVDVPPPEPAANLSQSLASIDSEGSWLSGRPRAGSKRSSAQMISHSLRESASSLQRRQTEYSESAEELGIAEDEYFGRLTPGPDEHFNAQSRRRQSGAPYASSDEEDVASLGSPGERSKWGAVGRQATIIQSESRAKSREGILNDFDSDSGNDDPGETSLELHYRSSTESVPLRNFDEPKFSRATSVNLAKGHVRHLSAGSARLLDVKARPSGESKRASMDPPRRSEDKRLDKVEG